MGIFSSNAPTIYDAGFNPIPCEEKRPQGGDHARWGALRMGREYLEEDLCRRYAASGVGIILGDYGIAIDVDFEDDDFIKQMPYTPMVRRGATGVAAIYRNDDKLKTDMGGLALELRSYGLFLVLPPSMHPDTLQPYEWCKGSELTHYKELPSLKLNDWLRLKALATERLYFRKTKRKSQESTDQLPDLPGVGGRNNYLYNCVVAWANNEFKNGIANVEEGVRYLINLDRKRHGADAWFFDENEHIGADKQRSPEERAEQMIKRTIKKIKGEPAINHEVLKAKLFEAEMARLNQTPGDETATVSVVKTDWNSLIPQGGLIAHIVRYTTKSSGFEIPQLWLGSAISLLSMAAGNRLRLGAKTWPNTYCFLMANSGVGKSQAKDAHLKILLKAGIKGNELGKGKFASTGAITMNFDEQSRRKHCIMDEATGLLKQLGNPGKESAFVDGVTTLCDLFSCGWTMYLGKEARTKDAKDARIVNPQLTIMALGTIAGFEDCLSESLVTSGLVARSLWFFDQRSKEEIEAAIDRFNIFSNAASEDPPEELTNALAQYFNRPYEVKQSKVAYDGGSPPALDVPAIVMAEGVEDRINKVFREGLRLGAKYAEERPEWAPSYQRRGELVMKLVIVACVDRCTTMATLDMVEWAERVWDAQFENIKMLLAKAKFNVSFQEMLTMEIEKLADAKAKPMRVRDFNKKFKQRFDRANKGFAFNDWYKTLKEEGLIIESQGEQGLPGRTGRVIVFSNGG